MLPQRLNHHERVPFSCSVALGWPASLLQFYKIQTTAKAGLITAGASVTATEAFLEIAGNAALLTARGAWVVLAWNFLPYITAAAAVFVAVSASLRKPRARVPFFLMLSTAFGIFVTTAMVLVTVAYFRAEASLRMVAITRFPGDGGFRELTSATVIPAVDAAGLRAGRAALGSTADRSSLTAWRTNVPRSIVYKVPLGDRPDDVALWTAPSASFNYDGAGAKSGQGVGVLMTGARGVDSTGVVTDVGPSAEVLGFVTWSFGFPGVASGQGVRPLACGSGGDTPRADAGPANVCGVTAWVSAQAVALRSEGVARAVEALEAEAAGIGNASLVARATVLTQVPDVRGVLTARRADVAFANDIYLAYTVTFGGVQAVVLLLMLIVVLSGTFGAVAKGDEAAGPTSEDVEHSGTGETSGSLAQIDSPGGASVVNPIQGDANNGAASPAPDVTSAFATYGV